MNAGKSAQREGRDALVLVVAAGAGQGEDVQLRKRLRSELPRPLRRGRAVGTADREGWSAQLVEHRR